MRIDVLTIFPNVISAVIGESLIKKAREKNLVEFKIWDIREFTTDKHNTVDDTPFGGGGGMVMKVEPLAGALEKVLSQLPGKKKIILTSASGKKFDQKMAQEFSQEENLIIICGHYAGVDERLKNLFELEEVSIGDFVLTGGELPALVVIDAVVRLIPGVLGNFQSAENDSFYSGILGFPQYTRPQTFKNLEVPEILISGDHEKVRIWRRKEALRKTFLNRPDLLEKATLSDEDKKILSQIKNG
ncbi:MAG: tRNA (guanine-N(1)-)-methyltransferase [candidate division Zixibacteria bacterium RBG-1]|nr:MAG: tRNA (guanine-N(1)-)-methyltransferase [candidate division Zixibacteria bacterium RBG-1]OGC83770.1 MAG: tRNA (guanosine(37)-N1)-methyltransferase TrmD [candidate division Zixibacteria bacterium RBG_19FT_COMBO_42_43]